MKHSAFSIISKVNSMMFARKTDDIPTTQENSHVEITNEDNAHHFLRYKGYCSL